MSRFLAHTFGTFFGVGHLPIIPATWTSLVVAILFLIIPIADLRWQITFAVVTLVVGVPACTRLEREYGEDPKQATMDEACGMGITLLGLEPTVTTVGLGFVLFRIFDVVKPPPARKLESLHGGWGIMLDDVFAGVYARLVLAGFLWLQTRI